VSTKDGGVTNGYGDSGVGQRRGEGSGKRTEPGKEVGRAMTNVMETARSAQRSRSSQVSQCHLHAATLTEEKCTEASAQVPSAFGSWIFSIKLLLRLKLHLSFLTTRFRFILYLFARLS